METFNCMPSVTNSKYRPNLPSNFYHNVPRNMRQIGSEYALPNCTSRRSAPSITHTWQERPPRTPVSCIGVEHKSSKGKLCSIALAIASFVVLVAVLAIAGLALYMGVLHTETPNALITFSCSAKILRGDRFIGALQEKARRYKRQLEALYQRSILGSALISCVVDKFGDDSLTIYFRLAFNRKKLSKTVVNVEKTIKDILLTDAISRTSVFKTIRFDSKHVHVKQITDGHHSSFTSPQNIPSSKSITPSTKTGVVLKSFNKSTVPYSTAPKKSFPTEHTGRKEGISSVIHGSFKISKTEADIIEKKTDISTAKPKTEKVTTPFVKRTTFKESSLTSALYKIASVEKIPKQTTVTMTSTVPTKSIATTATPATPKTPTSTSATSVKSVFVSNPFDNEPWIPILPELSAITENSEVIQHRNPIVKPTIPALIDLYKKQPTYTSFTNPGLSYNFNDAERLGSTSLKSHPIPVNKIPLTEPSTFFNLNTESSKEVQNINTESSKLEEISDSVLDQSSFVEIETLKYVPGSIQKNDELRKEELLKNVSTMFHSMESAEEVAADTSASEISGQGHVEVVVEDNDDLLLRTTKEPLVTLLPVKSNSGIGRPVRRKPHKPNNNNISVENRSFPSQPINVNINQNDNKGGKPSLDNYKIVGVLNFATERSLNDNEGSDIIRFPKMGLDHVANDSEIVVYVTNSSISSSRNDVDTRNSSNILSPEKLKQLSEISKIFDNSSMFDKEPVISTKAISSSYTVNHSGLSILTKTLNKVNGLAKNDTREQLSNLMLSNVTDCEDFGVQCGDGKCLAETTKCNQLIDCSDGKDELNCNCADYLKSQYLLRKICDGVVDCWDYSDENKCEWCQPNQHVCSNSKVCVDKTKICDGIKHCPHGDDERQCVTVAANIDAAEEFPYYSEGYLMVRKQGKWGKLCVENFENVVSSSHVSWQISDLGKAVCKSMTYQTMDFVKIVTENDDSQEETDYFELTYSFKNETKSSLSFKTSSCKSKLTVKVKCQALECGARPQVLKHIARVVGGGNAGLGSWPWQAALYKEGEFQCGATLLSSRWLVSAGHCFYHSQEEHWVARLGALRRGTALPSPYEQLRSIIRIIVHPGYIDSGFINDISLLQMEFPVVFSDYVRPVCLPQLEQLPTDGQLCTVVGWGQLFEVGRIFPDTLQEVQVPIISTSECRKRTLFLPLYKITDDMFCAGYERGGRDACLGDSGGPLMCPESNGRWTLHGITSNGYGCARANRPGVYTKVANYVEWINFNLNNEDYSQENSTKGKIACSGHRCPLGECLPESRLCNGYIECSDGSDEKNC